MTEEKYQEFLKTAPQDHFSDEFIQFLVDNNDVVSKDWNWLVIQNKKYWTPENNWVTAFFVAPGLRKRNDIAFECMFSLVAGYSDCEVLIKAPHKRSVKLFHVHMYKK